ncbi:hypothetical protein CHX27_11095 [Flavobacterium aurantiibacter]|uniref:Uncharacterized protein n=1 Tax=Flavobacterium aurantiibacter TaxID=2023067 RepID=A0A255ZNI9_9FLAO|nr:hypothetical protein CHX27_11095 [Flavobacterium aurantiibacter]
MKDWEIGRLGDWPSTGSGTNLRQAQAPLEHNVSLSIPQWAQRRNSRNQAIVLSAQKTPKLTEFCGMFG